MHVRTCVWGGRLSVGAPSTSCTCRAQGPAEKPAQRPWHLMRWRQHVCHAHWSHCPTTHPPLQHRRCQVQQVGALRLGRPWPALGHRSARRLQQLAAAHAGSRDACRQQHWGATHGAAREDGRQLQGGADRGAAALLTIVGSHVCALAADCA